MLLLGAFLLPISPVGAAPQVIDRVFLIVNSQMMTQSEAEDIVGSLKAQIQQAVPEGPERDHQLAEVDRTAVDSLIQELLLLDRARVLKFEISDKEVDSQLDRISKSNPQLLTVMPESELQSRILKDLKKQRVLSREVDSKIRVEETEIQTACMSHRQALRQISLSQILFRVHRVGEGIGLLGREVRAIRSVGERLLGDEEDVEAELGLHKLAELPNRKGKGGLINRREQLPLLELPKGTAIPLHSGIV